MTPDPTTSALAIASDWLERLDLSALVAAALHGETAEHVDLVALGKAAGELCDAAQGVLGARVARRLIIADASGAALRPGGDVVVGEHPVPGAGSLAAGRRLVDFLGHGSAAELTVFLVSGGASSLCSWPADPLGLDGLAELWRAALGAGVDITTLNQLRAATSMIAGGGVLRHVTTARSRSLIMVDNVVSGAPWVASGLTYEYDPSADELTELLGRVRADGPLAARASAAAAARRSVMDRPVTTVHDNVIVADPALLLERAIASAAELGYEVHALGEAVQGDVEEVAQRFAAELGDLATRPGRHCVLGVGEVTVHVRGSGVGGRCQELAWTMATVLEALGCRASFVARSSDGRDYVEGVAGGWVDETTGARARNAGLDWAAIKHDNDANRGLGTLGQLIAGGHTGWNLCDLYVAVLEPGGSSIVASL
ncbi:MAG: DUF4147 domain-containing protein [Actinomycetales bacterium]|nr:DUF4147 domain-containing protein [Actinomycetales bacterium]